MLSVGIHENVSIELQAKDVNGKPVLNVVLTQPQGEEDLFDFTSATTEGSSTESTTVTDWPLTQKGYEDKQLKEVRSVKGIMADYQDKKAYRTALLGLVMDVNQIEWDPFVGLPVTLDDIKANPKVLQDDVLLAGMTKNLNEQTVNQFNQAADKSKLFRVALVRTSKAKNTPKLRDRYLNLTPLAESMDVPSEESKVGFTAGEIKAGLDNPNPVESDTDGKDTSVDATFGAQIKDPVGVPSNL